MSYIKKTIYGVSWIGLLRFITRAIAFVKIAIIARILTPSDFGIYGIATLVLAFLEIFTETGINVFFIQKEGELKDYIDTAWIISIARGIGMAVLIVLAAPFIVSFFKSPDALFLILLISLVPLIKGFINPSEIRYVSEMTFQKEFWFRTVVFFIDAAGATIAALLTHSPNSLIIGLIVGAIVEVFLSFIFITPRPKFAFDFSKAKHIVNRGKWVTGFGVLEYIFQNGDDVVVGKTLGEGALGIYQMAYKLAILPISEVADVFGKATLPIFADIADDKKKLRLGVLYTTLAVFILLLPIISLLFIAPKFVIQILLGNQWLAAASVLPILAIYAMIRALLNPALTAIVAMKKQEVRTLTSLVGTGVLFICIFPLLQMYGLPGIGIATIIASLATVPIVVYYSFKLFR